MKERIYYLKDNKTNKKRITVCLLTIDEHCTRGIAICNTNHEQFNRKIGLAIAKGKALKAMKQKKTCHASIIKPRESALILNHLPEEFISKCDYMPDLTDYERKLLSPF